LPANNLSLARTTGETSLELETPCSPKKYILLLETLRSMAERGPAYPDGAPKVMSTSPHVPIKQPGAGNP
jgi:hypothetical protein